MILFFLLAYSFVILLRTDGPFDLIQKFRTKLFAISKCNFGHFFFKLLECPYCIGFWSSILSAIILFPISHMTVVLGFVGAVCIYIVESIMLSIQTIN